MAGNNAQYKIVELGNGIRYGTLRNMNAERRRHFAKGFNREAFTGRYGSINSIYWDLGKKLRAQLDSGDLFVRQEDGMLVPFLGTQI